MDISGKTYSSSFLFQIECPTETSEPLVNDLDGIMPDIGTRVKLEGRGVFVVMKGITGIGKSTIANTICERAGYSTVALDDLEGKGKQRRERLAKIFAAMFNDPTQHVVIFSSNNSQERDYTDYVDLAHKHKWNVLVIYPSEFDTPREWTNLIELSYQSMLSRENHPTIQKGSMNDEDYALHCRKIIDGFVNRMRAPKATNGVMVESLQFTKSGERRRINDIVENFKALIEKCMATPMVVNTTPTQPIESIPTRDPEQLYIKLKLIPEDRKTLMSSIPQLANVPQKYQKVFHHATLMHISSKVKSPEHWEKLKLLKGKMLLIVPHSYVCTNKNIIVVNIDILDDAGQNMNDLVYSGVPHITGAVPPKFRHANSIQILKNTQHAETFVGKELRFQCVVE